MVENRQQVNIGVGPMVSHRSGTEEPNLRQAFTEHPTVANDRFGNGSLNRFFRRRAIKQGFNGNAGS